MFPVVEPASPWLTGSSVAGAALRFAVARQRTFTTPISAQHWGGTRTELLRPTGAGPPVGQTG